MKSLKDLLVGSRLGRIAILTTQSLMLTPNDFNQDDNNQQKLYARLGFGAIPIAAQVFAFCVSQAVCIMFKEYVPNISGVSGADYATILSSMKMSAYVLYWMIAALFIIITSGWIYFFHRFMAWISSKYDISMTPMPLVYFTLILSSNVLVFGLMLLTSVLLFHSFTVSDFTWLENYTKEHPWQLLAAGYAVLWVRRRQEYISRVTADQLYPNIFLRYATPFLTFFIPFVLFLTLPRFFLLF